MKAMHREPRLNAACENCGEPLEGVLSRKRFCDSRCRSAYKRKLDFPPPPYVGRYDLLPEHIRKNFTPDDPDECWVYAKRAPNGYATNTSVNNFKANAYRLIYLMMVGPIPDGHDLDHTCDNGPGGCVNPHHLTPRLHRANVLRSAISVPGQHIRKTHCPQGHPYDEENTYWYGPNKEWRRCRICNHRDQVRARTLHRDRYREGQRRYEQSEKGRAKRAARVRKYRERGSA